MLTSLTLANTQETLPLMEQLSHFLSLEIWIGQFLLKNNANVSILLTLTFNENTGLAGLSLMVSLGKLNSILEN